MTTETIFNTTCKICNRVAFGSIVVLGLNQWRHEECAIGSQEWKAYYHRLPEAEQALLAEFYHFFYGRGPHHEKTRSIYPHHSAPARAERVRSQKL